MSVCMHICMYACMCFNLIEDKSEWVYLVLGWKIIKGKDMLVLRSAECGTDHFMVRGKFKFRIQKKSRMTGVQLPNVSMLLSRATEFCCHGNRLISYQDVTTPNCSQVNLRKSHEVENTVDAILHE